MCGESQWVTSTCSHRADKNNKHCEGHCACTVRLCVFAHYDKGITYPFVTLTCKFRWVSQPSWCITCHCLYAAVFYSIERRLQTKTACFPHWMSSLTVKINWIIPPRLHIFMQLSQPFHFQENLVCWISKYKVTSDKNVIWDHLECTIYWWKFGDNSQQCLTWIITDICRIANVQWKRTGASRATEASWDCTLPQLAYFWVSWQAWNMEKYRKIYQIFSASSLLLLWGLHDVKLYVSQAEHRAAFQCSKGQSSII